MITESNRPATNPEKTKTIKPESQRNKLEKAKIIGEQEFADPLMPETNTRP